MKRFHSKELEAFEMGKTSLSAQKEEEKGKQYAERDVNHE